MGLFSSSPSYIGVDFDLHSVKIVELRNEKGKPRLVTYGYFDHDLERKASDRDENVKKETAALIREICKKANVTTKNVVSALPAFSVFSSVITLPGMTQKELSQAVKWEAKKVIPLPLDEMILHWEVLGTGESLPDGTPAAAPAGLEHAGSDIMQDTLVGENSIGESGLATARNRFLRIARKKDVKSNKILLTAAPKDLVHRYIEIFKETGLTLLSLDTEPFSLIRSLVGHDTSTVMVVDIDYTVTNISVVQNKIPFLNRSINVGGLTITRAIASSLNITLKRAEQFKYDIGIMTKDSAASEIPKTIEQSITPIIDEIKYSLNLFKSQGRENIEKIILTGGSSLLTNFPEYLSRVLNLKVYLGDPWARVMYPEELRPALQEVGPRFSVCIGLAMKEIR